MLTWLVIIGGLQSIARVAVLLAPIMVVVYLVGAGYTLLLFAGQIPHALGLIFKGAFDPAAVGGGAAGATIATAMRFGLARGAYSNEAGTGTAAVFHAPAKTSEPVRQGLLASFDVFLDTLVICTVTALAVLVTGAWTEDTTSAAMTVRAFEHALPRLGGMIVALSSLLFGFTSLIGAPYYGETSLAYLLGVSTRVPFRWLYCSLVLIGALTTVEVAWSIGDLRNGLMVITNLIGLIGLSNLAIRMVNDYRPNRPNKGAEVSD